MYDKYRDMTYKQFDTWIGENWTKVSSESIKWYIENEDKISKYWDLWKPSIIYNIIIPANECIEARRKEDQRLYNIFLHNMRKDIEQTNI